MEQDKFIGRLLDNRYEIQEVIGVGGMAVVYKARCHRLNRLVAIKILKEDYRRDEEFRRRFHAESQAVAMLSHPNIVSVYDVSTSEDADYIVMELIDSISLKQYMEKKGVLNWKETLHFAIQIAKALEHAHAKGIVHRDIKPHNVMVLKNGSVKVTDFGIARLMSKGNTLTKEALGSVHYISPEQAKGGRVDNRSDLYSLGVVMYEMMTGRPPYDGESPVAVAIQHINGGAPLPSTLNPNIPGGLEQIIMKAMAHDPDDRYPTATAMLYDMDEFRKNPSMLFDYNLPPLDEVTRLHRVQPEEPKERHTEPIRPAVPRRTQTQPQQTPRPRPRRPSRAVEAEEAADARNRVATIAVIVCSLVAIAAIAIFLIVMFQDNSSGPKVEYVSVPTYLNKNIENIPEKEGIVIEISRVYSEEFEKGMVIDQNPKPGDMVVKYTKVTLVVSLGKKPEERTMEKLVGMEQTSAENFLNNQGYVPLVRQENSDIYEEGIVTRTEPGEGEPLQEGQTVTVWVSKGPEKVMQYMPNVVGLTLESAQTVLNKNGFFNLDFEPVDSNAPENEVVWQSVERNTRVDVTELITLHISKGPTEPPTEPTTEPPTEPPTVPTTQPPTQPPQPSVPTVSRKTVTWTLPKREQAYTLSVRDRASGETVYIETVQPGKETTTLTLDGFGTQVYELYVDGVLAKEETVVFSVG